MAIQTSNIITKNALATLPTAAEFYVEQDGALQKVGYEALKNKLMIDELTRCSYKNAGKEIGLSWAQISAQVKTGDFTGFNLGDYKDITLKTTGEKVRLEVSGYNSYMYVGDNGFLTTPHLVFTTKDCLKDTVKYNDTNTSDGGYPASKLYTYMRDTIEPRLPDDLVAVIHPLKRLLQKNNGEATTIDWSWYTEKVWLLNNIEVSGTPGMARPWGQGDGVHLPIFAWSWAKRMKGLGYESMNASNRNGVYWYWTNSPSSGWTGRFCIVNGNGACSNYGASSAGGIAFGLVVK